MHALLCLLDSTNEQFAFSLLPVEMRESWGWMLFGAVVEFRFFQFLASVAHFGEFHCVTFLRVVQSSLVHSAEIIR